MLIISTEKPYDPEAISKKISEGHALKHVNRSREIKHWQNLGVETKQAFETHILKTLIANDTKVFHAHNNRDIYYNEKTNTVVIVHLSSFDKGSCHLPTSKERYFQKQAEMEIEAREYLALKLGPLEIKTGGYTALYSKATEFEQRYKNFQENKELSYEQRLMRLEEMKRTRKDKSKDFYG